MGFLLRNAIPLQVPKQKVQFLNWDLTFNISTTDADTIDTFLDARFDDQANFDFTPPHHSSALKFICTARSRTAILNNRVSMNLTFEQVAEP